MAFLTDCLKAIDWPLQLRLHLVSEGGEKRANWCPKCCKDVKVRFKIVKTRRRKVLVSICQFCKGKVASCKLEKTQKGKIEPVKPEKVVKIEHKAVESETQRKKKRRKKDLNAGLIIPQSIIQRGSAKKMAKDSKLASLLADKPRESVGLDAFLVKE